LPPEREVFDGGEIDEFFSVRRAYIVVEMGMPSASATSTGNHQI
jgi:hypothetical protein